jgi:hypothetical protein
MNFPYADSVTERIETVVGRQLKPEEYDQIKNIVANAAENYAAEYHAENKAMLTDGIESALRAS